MFVPDMPLVCKELAQAYSIIRRVDAFAFASMNTLIGRLSPDPDWLGPMRKELELLSTAGAKWQQAKPSIWSDVLTQFSSYTAQFAATASVVHLLGNDRQAWLKVLEQLHKTLETSEKRTRDAEDQFELQVNQLKNTQAVFNTSLDKAWAALAHEEQGMMSLAAQVTALQDKLHQLEDKLDSTLIAGGKNYTQSTASITYTLVSSAGVEIPYLSVVTLVYTLGKGLYDVVVTDHEIDKTINQIVDLRVKLSEEAQAAAMSKALIQLITNFDLSLTAIGYRLPAISQMWATEKDKIADVIDALNAGAYPSQLTDLQGMTALVPVWKDLNTFALNLLQGTNQGKPVTIVTSKPDAATP